MRRPLLLLLLSSASLLAWFARPWVAAGPPGSLDEEAHEVKPARAGLKLQGVGSCAAAACHNANGPRGSKGSEYTTWVNHDPHARAYAVLFEDRSRRMLENFRERKDEKSRPEKEALCLSCHVHPAPDLKPPPHTERFSLSDGVGCEACHGPAQKWLAKHYLPEWQDPRRRAELGMINTQDLRVRAEVCVRCHVGEREMDVNHDLIAAGHPRLRFEYGSYLANYHFRHWKLSDDRKRHPDHEARAWLLGQLVSAEAALKLLEHRAAGAADPKRDKPWPEFAEYNCAACHHDLRSSSSRQERGFAGRKPGQLPWGTWYYPLLPTLAEQTPGKGALRGPLKALDGLMGKRLPPEGKVLTEAGRAAQTVRQLLVGVEKECPGAKGLDSLMRALALAELGPATTWDEETQRYLGLAALHNGLGDLRSPSARRPGLAEALRALRDELERSFPPGQNSLYDTPSRFDPEKVRQKLNAVRERLK